MHYFTSLILIHQLYRQKNEMKPSFLLNSACFQQALREMLQKFLNILIPLNMFCCVLPRFRSNLLGNLKTITIELTKTIKGTKTQSFKNACFPRFRLGFISCFVRSSRGGRTGKPRALPVRPPRENRGRCAYDFRRYCRLQSYTG